MSDELYLRKVILKIIPQSGTGKQIENLRISFNVKKNSEGNPNEATIKIFNLSQNTRSILERPKNKVSLGSRIWR
jgi:hypothetical protein